MQNDQYKNFLKDIVLEVKSKKIENEIDDFDKGYNFAIYEVISLFIQQSDAFELNKKEFGLNEINPEKDYLKT